jgi:hypothetical protein
LDEGFRVWPSKCIDSLLAERLNQDIKEWQEGDHEDEEILQVWAQLIQVILRSKTAHAFYGALSLKKRKEWLFNFNHSLENLPRSIVQAYQNEFSAQPYCGFYLFFLLFEDLSENNSLMNKVQANLTDFDYLAYL